MLTRWETLIERISLLQGGFAKCYELTDLSSNYVYAGKVVQKAMLTKPYQRDKVIYTVTYSNKLNVFSPSIFGLNTFDILL